MTIDLRKAWATRQDADAARDEAERRAARVGGDVIRLPVQIAPPGDEVAYKRARARFEFLGLNTTPIEAEVQLAMRGGKRKKAITIMENSNKLFTPPAGFRRSETDPSLWINVENGEIVAYWCHGSEYTPAEYAEKFNGGFDPAAAIATSHTADIGKGELRDPTYDSGFHDGQRVIEDHNLSLSLYDMFSVNGGGFDI